MKYVIMCGGNAKINGIDRHCVRFQGERIIDRTIRLLKQCGVSACDIAITATAECFDDCIVNVVYYDSSGDWVNAFYPEGDDPVCYIFGDVVFSPNAIKTIVETETSVVEFFASAPPFAKQYTKHWAEPFAFKVVDRQFFRDCVDKVKRLKRKGEFRREPIAWELWQVIKDTPLNHIIYDNYVVINDYTCDIDNSQDMYCMSKILG